MKMMQRKTTQMDRANDRHGVLSLGLALVMVWLLPTEIFSQDAIYQFKSGGGSSKITGKITNVSPDSATIDGKQIPANEIDRLYFAKEPVEVNRAREQMNAGQYSNAIEELSKLDAGEVTGRLQPEVDFIRAFSSARISLTVGSIPPQTAGKEVRDFIVAHGDSIHLCPAIEQYGKLLFAFGRPELAAAEFEKLTQCSWPEYKLRGQFQLGKALSEAGQPAEAKSAFDAILAYQSNDDLSQTYKLLAKCESARLSGLQGNVEQGIQAINEIIETENSENNLLFANLYNALGSLYEKSGQLKEARSAYLHTELLYASESEPHAEALFRLAGIWLQLDETDRANLARETLKSRYRNSYWAGKL